MKGDITMAIDFKNINLEVLDITTNASPDMFVNLTGISFTKRILDEMNYPANVQYAIDAGNKVFAIRACKVNDAKAVPFSKPKSEQKTTLSSNNKNLVETIRALMKDEWKPDARYKVTGFYISENKTMIFDLSEGVEEEFRPKEEK